MIYVGIDVAKDKHDCFITNSEGEVLEKPFTIQNNQEGFDSLFGKISGHAPDGKVKVGLEATGHYSYNILGYLLDKGLATYVLNPLLTSLFRKGQSLRKTKTDKVDSSTIAHLLMSEPDLKPYSLTSYHNEELKSLTRYRFTKVRELAKLKISIARLVCILFPELEALVPTLHLASVYALLAEFPGASYVASANLTHLTHLLSESSNGRYGKELAVTIREAARHSIGASRRAESLELRHTIELIRTLEQEIEDIENEIKPLVDELHSPILSIPGISYRMGAMILAEIGDFERFDSPDRLLAFAGLSPTTYQSGQLTSTYSHMEKRGSKYLRYALFNAAKYVCHWDPGFAAYLAKKRKEGKHYNVAVSHAVKKLVRLIFHLIKANETYVSAA